MYYGEMSGKGKIYDSLGKPILQKGENVISSAWARYMVYEGILMDRFVLDLYDGPVFCTNRRLIGIREPDPRQARWARAQYTADFDIMATYEKVRMVKEMGGYEYFSLPYGDVMKVRQFCLLGTMMITAPRMTGRGKAYINIAPLHTMKRLFGEPGYGKFVALGKK